MEQQKQPIEIKKIKINRTPQLSPKQQIQHKLQIKQQMNLIIGKNIPIINKIFLFKDYNPNNYLHVNPWKKYFETDIKITSHLLFKTVPVLSLDEKDQQSMEFQSRKYNIINSNNIVQYGDEFKLTTFIDDEAMIQEPNDVYKNVAEYDFFVKQLRDFQVPLIVEELVQTNGVLREWVYYDFKLSSIYRYDQFVIDQVNKCWSCMKTISKTPEFYISPSNINEYREVCFNIQHFKTILESHLFPDIYQNQLISIIQKQNLNTNYQQIDDEDIYYFNQQFENLNLDSEYQIQNQQDLINKPKLNFQIIMYTILMNFISDKQIDLTNLEPYYKNLIELLNHKFYKFYVSS